MCTKTVIKKYSTILSMTVFISMPCLMVPTVVYSANYTQDLTFETYDQSMWGPGIGTTIDYSDFWGVRWGQSGSFGDIVWERWDLDTGIEVWAKTNGRIGLDFGFFMDSGSVDVVYPVAVELLYPDTALPGETITISSQYTVDPTAFFATNFPEIQTHLELIFDVYAGLGAKICAFGSCDQNKIEIDIDKEFELLAINRDADGEFRLLGDDLGGFQFGERYDFGYGGVTVWLPDIETNGKLNGGNDALNAEGKSDLFELNVDIDSLVTTSLGIPPLEGDFWIFEYNLLDVEAGPDLDIEQSFSFDPDLMIRMDLGTGEVVEFPFGGSVDIVMPSSDLEITPTFSIPNTFTNETLLGIDLLASIFVLEASIDRLGSIGPLFSKNWGFNLLDVPLFDKTFPLAFEGFTTEAFMIEAVPEPGTVVFFGIGLFGMFALLRRRRRKN